jgi:hypothetical protein
MGFAEGNTVRGHIKLFMLQMNLEKYEQPKIARAAENAGFDLCRNASSSVERISLPTLELMSGR